MIKIVLALNDSIPNAPVLLISVFSYTLIDELTFPKIEYALIVTSFLIIISLTRNDIVLV